MRKQADDIFTVCIWFGLATGIAGCVPAVDHHQTTIEPASAAKITMNKQGKVELVRVDEAKQSEEGSESTSDADGKSE